ncbi:hypothetical protein BZL30_3583 [Mycobacterium kansasii]|uniref:Uncharacterized protein n=1 Tax=Mycobacterium kansasii TaxID=1768 RepID=A0A1V3X9D4_MYCKA|nr:hypothetical protein BZL30_3583 [Mycobacterium kansasii]
MSDLIVGCGPELRCTAAWFEVLKLERRRLRIRSGNAQELYFPVCFELAVTKGPPAPDDRETAAAVLHQVHRAGTAPPSRCSTNTCRTPRWSRP